MDYNKHKEEIDRATQLWECGDITRENLEYIFPELCESDDEKIRNVIRGWIYTQPASFFDNGISKKEMLDWLENQNKETSWKPSKEEMDALYGLSYITNKMDDKKDVAITKLYQDLKKEFFNGASYENMFSSSPVDSNINVENQGEQEEPQVYETEDGEIITYSENEGYKIVEPKFEIEKGKWYVCNTSRYTDFIVGKAYYCPKNGMLRPNENEMARYVARDCFHPWSISDAKDGDILAYVTDEEDLWIMIYWSLYEPYEGHVHYHALLVNDSFSDKGTCCICIDDLKPATKEQSELLFQRMKEAGYEFDFEKKELKIVETQCEQKCSEEDDAYQLFTISAIEDYYDGTNPLQKELVNWLKSLKDRAQTKQEWREEDKIRLDRICKTLWKNRKGDTDEIYQQEQDINWLKSLRPGSCWKPNKDQIIALRWVLNNIPYNKHKEEISGLLDQIKVL